MEQVLASVTLLVGQLAIGSDYTIADRTFDLALERSIDVPLERGQRIDQAAVEDRDSSQRSS